MNAFDKVFRALVDAGCKPKNGTALCPAHSDRMPSLTYKQGSDGRVLLFCHKGCSFDSIMEKLGLDESDAFRDSSPIDLSKPEAVYEYRNSDGTLAYRKIRYPGKRFVQESIDPETGQIVKKRVGKGILYRLPELLEAIENQETIYLVEGEKDCDNGISIGLHCTTAPNGANSRSWTDEFTKIMLRAYDIVIIADNDDVGIKYARDVAKILDANQGSVKIITVPVGKDLSDWIASGATKEDVDALASDAEVFYVRDGDGDPEEIITEAIGSEANQPPQDDPGVGITYREDELWKMLTQYTTPPSIPTVVPGFSIPGLLVPGELVFLAGRPETGKSTLCAQLAADICMKKTLVGIVSLEMDEGGFCQPLIANIVRCHRSEIHFPLDKFWLPQLKGAKVWLNVSSRVRPGSIESMLEKNKGTKVIIIDNLAKLSSGKRAESETLRLQYIVEDLRDIAVKYKVAMILIGHLNRIEGGVRPTINNLRGSDAAGILSDSVLAIYNPTKSEPGYVDNPVKLMSIVLAKGRHCSSSDITVEFHRHLGRFYDTCETESTTLLEE